MCRDPAPREIRCIFRGKKLKSQEDSKRRGEQNEIFRGIKSRHSGHHATFAKFLRPLDVLPLRTLPGPDLHRLIAPALPGAFFHSITSSASC
jgi:hypothetical protein